MSLLRHPVVITSVEEDFRRIGLITEEHRDEEDAQETEEEAEAESELSTDESDESDEAAESADDEVDADAEGEDEDTDESGVTEALAFHAALKSKWDEWGEAGVETVDLSDDQMEELEGFAESVMELSGDVIGEGLDDDEETDADDAEDGSGQAHPYESVAEAMRAIESLLDEDVGAPQSMDEAAPAFANLALVAEKLYGFFEELATVEDDVEYAEIAETYEDIAKCSAEIVTVLQTEDPDAINLDAVTEMLNEYLGTVLSGLETYAVIREAMDDDSDADADDSEEGDSDEEIGEGENEGNE